MEKAYFYLFTEISNLMEELTALRSILVSVQQNAEEIYISSDSETAQIAEAPRKPL